MAETERIGKGADRAAVLLLALGEQAASNILKHMNPKEVQKVGVAMASLSNVSTSQVETVVTDFIRTVEGQTALGVGSEEYIRNVMISALGEDKAGSLMDRILTGATTKGLEALKWMDPKAVAEIIRSEHPQIIAIVLSYLESDQSAQVLSMLPERTQPDILMRIASLDGIHPGALKELDEILEKQFSGNNNVKSTAVGGKRAAADILNLIDASKGNKIMDFIKESDMDLGQKIEDLMFVFDNLIDVDDRGIQALLREVSSDSLILAMKGADEPIKEKIFKNMSKRASEMLREDLEAKGPVKLSEVEVAQKEILAIARRMAEAGEIALGGQGGEEYV
jgi:flagellar motor switch protein FliG